MKILIFGGNSFTAQHFIWRDKYDCQFVSRSDLFTTKKNYSFIDHVTGILTHFQPDVIINLISISATSIEKPSDYLGSNFTICKNLTTLALVPSASADAVHTLVVLSNRRIFLIAESSFLR